MGGVEGVVLALFQFTPLREGRQQRPSRPVRQIHFNSRPSARGDRGAAARSGGGFRFQFTPLREGRRPPAQLHQDGQNISIHAPPRGATESRSARRSGEPFQFTPLREGRQPTPTPTPPASYFNSRPSARGDGKRYAISANLLFNPYKSAWLNNRATQFVEIILVIFHRIIA